MHPGVVQAAVHPVPAEKVVVSTVLDQHAVVQYQDAVRPGGSGQPVGDGDRRPAGCEVVERSGDAVTKSVDGRLRRSNTGSAASAKSR